MSRAVQAHIDLAAVKHNLQVVRQLAPTSKVLAVIKANGYGHGMAEIAHALQGVDAYGVACIKEARSLRQQGIVKPILLLAGWFSSEELYEAEKLDLDVVVHQVEQVEELASVSLGKPLRVWLKVDTGMRRLGIFPESFAEVSQRLRQCSSVSSVNLMTHFSCADEPERKETIRQIACFDELEKDTVEECSLANSAGLIKFPTAQREWVRPGLMLYGAVPFEKETGLDYGLKPVMTYSSHLMAIKQCKKGDAIGYGGAYVCPEDMPIGLIAVGYGDGYPRHAQEGTPVLLNERRVPLIGRVSMDSIFVDLSTFPDAKIGDRAILWGQGLPIEEVAVCSNTIPYELFCKVTERVNFNYVE